MASYTAARRNINMTSYEDFYSNQEKEANLQRSWEALGYALPYAKQLASRTAGTVTPKAKKVWQNTKYAPYKYGPEITFAATRSGAGFTGAVDDLAHMVVGEAVHYRKPIFEGAKKGINKLRDAIKTSEYERNKTASAGKITGAALATTAGAIYLHNLYKAHKKMEEEAKKEFDPIETTLDGVEKYVLDPLGKLSPTQAAIGLAALTTAGVGGKYLYDRSKSGNN